ncbi:nucleotide-binding universal stress UspA family protein [Paenarthrobacter nicotinovorans]|uniref:universal stress protein n=1 Tax=Micrococcaceae TaxID=1268 RepID=UPI0008760B2A|nr:MULTISPECIES: universal stress protein [Micrococcaceae]MDR6436666.1 nucleotide-binding universal stress UspA family protein [Paenarthrobacter nicotinovorans]SCZ56972.1 Nucleotide-binding universal stress protein, UspA family [Arthrobacter sp. UNCCL28]
MGKDSSPGRIVVGVDGSEASIEALREAQRLAVPLGGTVEAIAYWDFPPVYEGYVAMGITGFEEAAGQVLKESVEKAFGIDVPNNVNSHLEQGHPRQGLIKASRGAEMVVVGRRGHGGFGGLLMGSVSSACVAHAHCPVLVVHTPEKEA